MVILHLEQLELSNIVQKMSKKLMRKMRFKYKKRLWKEYQKSKKGGV